MHTIPELGTSVPAFLAKLWKLVEDPETDDLICWSPNGRSFFIRNQAQFARELLPHYYKHNNMASFVRQLNMYGFHKKVSVELGGLKCDRDEMEFAHQFFCKGHPYLVEHIKRKIASSKGQDPALTPIKPELMNKMLSEVRSMRGRQEHLDSRLGAMKRENEALWRELAMLRQKHLKQQQIVNKLIHFLVTLVQPSRSGGLSVKRRYPLMIDDSNRQRNKQAKISKSQASPAGPVIHELDASEPDLDSEYIVAEMLEGHSNPSIESPEHNNTSIMDDNNIETVHLVDNSVQLQDDIQLINPQEIDAKKKRGCKGKKKRKNKMPVKILIPSTENGEEPREETHLLEMPLEDSPVTIALLENKSISKPVPVATVRSSKLAAMAANMNKSPDAEQELDLENSADMEDDVQENDSALVKLEDILIVPEIIDEDDGGNENVEYNENNGNTEINGNENPLNQFNKADGNTEQNTQKDSYTNDVEKNMEKEKVNCNGAGTSNSKNLSLSCVVTSGMSDASYRLGSMEEMDNHLETMQTELENLREILRAEGYSIDANTLLGLFGADDPMSFGMPVNPELNPHSEKEEDEHVNVAENMNGSAAGGELMTYNPTPNLLDFDDDIFLGATSPVTSTAGDTATTSLYNSDPLDLEDSKTSLLDSLTNDVNTSS
ncbi:heat shock factor protein 1-like isoform X1 [Osmia bicornis bicornis]|uniref:heat shock factor protein 1-like isoform X1 n=2 Tax=Osmia bicornis bicornis TaxID=1437191 RepID=UPI0010F51210|nr:heat shock factor protein 1-like isoform X1 [Osmia bicornis bicornis]XP_029045694.1 heat shock factor protein 1-like isoform X1 [Osmia bicornis bicornis]XP_029045695.1 heat shock factor protein 1-like isoform X1 [Osmia bicornis bicornis]XP_029045696.1 heat shock factor protein 1-like isoform X1 [Osmia bicornis bicornis]